MNWWDEAACLGLAPAFDADYDDGLAADAQTLRYAARVCGSCPVMVECGLDAATEQRDEPLWRKPVGVRAGWLYQHGRKPRPILAPAVAIPGQRQPSEQRQGVA